MSCSFCSSGSQEGCIQGPNVPPDWTGIYDEYVNSPNCRHDPEGCEEKLHTYGNAVKTFCNTNCPDSVNECSNDFLANCYYQDGADTNACGVITGGGPGPGPPDELDCIQHCSTRTNGAGCEECAEGGCTDIGDGRGGCCDPDGAPSTSCTPCTPNCNGKQCGPNGCTKDNGAPGQCGTCSSGQTCNNAGQCETPCTPDCVGKNCGPNGCGGSCGACSKGTCNNKTGQCVFIPVTCNPNCVGKNCGPNGCGSTCGTCTGDKTCNTAGQCSVPFGGKGGTGRKIKGGCAGTRYGCCANKKTSKENKVGTNCPEYKEMVLILAICIPVFILLVILLIILLTRPKKGGRQGGRK